MGRESSSPLRAALRSPDSRTQLLSGAAARQSAASFFCNRSNGFRRVAFQAIVDEDVSRAAFLTHAANHGTQRIASFRILVANLIIRCKLPYRVFICATLAQQGSHHREIGRE